MKAIYFDCSRGISGDMAVAALIDAGADKEALQRALDTIPDAVFKTEITSVMKNGIAACDFNVILPHPNHDHDMEYLFGEDEEHAHHHHDHHHGHHHENEDEHKHKHKCEKKHKHKKHDKHNDEAYKKLRAHCAVCEKKHCKTCEFRREYEETRAMEKAEASGHHNEEHSHDHYAEHNEAGAHTHKHAHAHHEPHRGLNEIFSIIDKTEMTENARSLAKKIFDIIADAEARAHNTSKYEVHFHEVGAVDSIVDVISAAVCFDSLDIGAVYSTPLMEGSGTIRCAHGILSVPVPAVANILSDHAMPLSVVGERGEFITPTGAAFLAAVNANFVLPKTFVIKKVGVGAGKREYKTPSLLRAMIIEETATAGGDVVTKIECNIDDGTGENMGFVQERLLEGGALDASVIPCYMKKNRPAFLLQVLCNVDDCAKIEAIIFEHTTTIGIRKTNMSRTTLERKNIVVQTKWGDVAAKEVSLNGMTRVYPEYDSVKKLCDEKGLSFVEVMNSVSARG